VKRFLHKNNGASEKVGSRGLKEKKLKYRIKNLEALQDREGKIMLTRFAKAKYSRLELALPSARLFSNGLKYQRAIHY